MTPDIRINNILNDIGNEIAFILDQHPNGSFLYSEAAENTCSVGIFLESEEVVTYFGPTDELFELVQNLWNVAEPDKKWSVFEYSVVDGRLNASFTYPDSIDADESDHDRYVRVLRNRYGEKPVIFPDDDDKDFVELTLDDLAHLDGSAEADTETRN